MYGLIAYRCYPYPSCKSLGALWRGAVEERTLPAVRLPVWTDRAGLTLTSAKHCDATAWPTVPFRTRRACGVPPPLPRVGRLSGKAVDLGAASGLDLVCTVSSVAGLLLLLPVLLLLSEPFLFALDKRPASYFLSGPLCSCPPASQRQARRRGLTTGAHPPTTPTSVL